MTAFESGDDGETFASKDLFEAMGASLAGFATDEKNIGRFVGSFGDKASLEKVMQPLFCGWVVAFAVLSDKPEAFRDHLSGLNVPKFTFNLVLPALDFVQTTLKIADLDSKPKAPGNADLNLKHDPEEVSFEKAQDHFVSLLVSALDKVADIRSPIEVLLSVFNLILNHAYNRERSELLGTLKSHSSVELSEDELQTIITAGFLCRNGLEQNTNDRLQQYREANPETAAVLEELASKGLP